MPTRQDDGQKFLLIRRENMFVFHYLEVNPSFERCSDDRLIFDVRVPIKTIVISAESIQC